MIKEGKTDISLTIMWERNPKMIKVIIQEVLVEEQRQICKVPKLISDKLMVVDKGLSDSPDNRNALLIFRLGMLNLWKLCPHSHHLLNQYYFLQKLQMILTWSSSLQTLLKNKWKW